MAYSKKLEFKRTHNGTERPSTMSPLTPHLRRCSPPAREPATGPRPLASVGRSQAPGTARRLGLGLCARWIGRLSDPLRRGIGVLLAFVICGIASGKELDLTRVGQEPLNLTAYASWAEDSTGTLSVDRVRSNNSTLEFKEFQGDAASLNAERSDSVFWIKVPIVNSGTTPTVRLLVMAQPLLDTIEVYREASDGLLQTTKTGHGMGFETRSYPHRLLVFPLQLAPREGQTVWLRVHSPFNPNLSGQVWRMDTFEAADHTDAMHYAWIGGTCAALAMVFTLLWSVTGQRSYAWFLGIVLTATWHIVEYSGYLPALLPWSGHALATVSYRLCIGALLFFTVGLLLQALDSQARDLPYRRILYALGGFGLVLAALAPWPLWASRLQHHALPAAVGILLLLTAWLAARGQRAFLWYGIGLVAPLLSMLAQQLSQTAGGDPVLLARNGSDNALALYLTVLAAAVLLQEIHKQRSQMRQLQGLLQAQKLALEHAHQGEIDLESQVSQRTRELAMAAQRLEALSTVDSLTGVANRRRFDKTLQMEWGRAARDKRPLSVAMIDVDWFKAYNDRYGHTAGDACLRQLARVFEAGVTRNGDLIARYGGEEFVLLAPDTDPKGIHTVASYLCQEIFAMDLQHEGSPHGRVSVSIGLATAYPHHGSKPLQLVQQADMALYRAKQQGRNRVVGPETEDL